MPIEKKSDLFYELTVRGCSEPQKGELGSVTTYKLTTGTALIDTEANALAAPYQPDAARDVTRDEAIKFLGEKFADALGQLTAERARFDAEREQEKIKHEAEIAEVKSNAAVVMKGLTDKLQAATIAAKSEQDAATTEANNTIARLTQERDALDDRLQQFGKAIARVHANSFPSSTPAANG